MEELMNASIIRYVAYAASIALVVASGCSSEAPKYAVQGTVTFKGEPLPYGTLRFYDSTASIVGSTSVESDGKYKVELVEGRCVATVYAVPRAEVSNDPNAQLYEGGIPPGTKFTGPNVPGAYGDVGTSPFVFDVSAGDNTFDIEIPAPSKRRR